MYQDPTQGSGGQPGMNGTGPSSVWNQHGFSQNGGGYAGMMGQQEYGAQPVAYPQSGPQGYAAQPNPFGQPQQSAYPQYGQPGGYPPADPQGMAGAYAQPPQGFAQQAQGYSQPVQGYGQPMQPQPYAQPQPDYQNRYSGQPANDGAWPQPQVADYRQQPDPRQPWPGQDVYNGPEPAPRQPFNWDLVLLIVACGLVPLLLILAMIFRNLFFTLFSVGGAVGAAVWLWQRPVFQRPTQMMITVLYAIGSLLAIILAVTALNRAPAAASQAAESPAVSPSSPVNSFQITPTPDSSAQSDTGLSGGVTDVQFENDETIRRANMFMDYWTQNNNTKMQELCAPSWAAGQTGSSNPKSALFQALKTNILISYQVTGITGTESASSRTVTYETTMRKFDGSEVPCTVSLMMVYENGAWYADPDSLIFTATTPTPPPTLVPVTPTPVPSGYVDPNTLLYYNPDGGSYYHLDPSCSAVGSKYKPLKGVFTYGERGSGKYTKLKPCDTCHAPR